MKINGKDLSRTYYRRSEGSNIFTAVKDVNIELSPGELLEITGRSGSGKSTVLNMLAGLLTPSSGTVLYDDLDIYGLEDKERSAFRNEHTGVIPQGQTALSSITVLENVLLPARLYNREASEDDAMELLSFVGIEGLKDVYPDQLSGGEMRRLSIARALINRPSVLLADEPTGDLDDENTKVVLSLLRNTADKGTAVLLVTHEEDAREYADRVLKMNGGILKEY